MNEIFTRSAAALGEEAINSLQHKKVAIFGLGGVGAACAEALARGGVGHLMLIDNDKVQKSNINRQLIALHSTLGLYKTDVAMQRLKDINPNIALTPHPTFYNAESMDIDLTGCDYIVDAIDSVASKIHLIKTAQALSIPLVSCMGTGNKLYPEQLVFADLFSTSVCPLCRVMRQRCRKEGINQVTVLYSTEEPKGKPVLDGSRLAPGSVSFVPPVAGMMLAGKVIRKLLGYSD